MDTALEGSSVILSAISPISLQIQNFMDWNEDRNLSPESDKDESRGTFTLLFDTLFTLTKVRNIYTYSEC